MNNVFAYLHKLLLSKSFSTLLVLFTLGVHLNSSANDVTNNTLILVQSGHNVPDNNGQYSTFGGLTINSSDSIVFSSRLTNTIGDNDDDSGFYRVSIERSEFPSVITIEQIVREDQRLSLGNTSYHIGDLATTKSGYKIANRPFGSFPIIGDFNNVALTLPLVANSGEFGDSIIVLESEDVYTLVAEASTPVASSNGMYREFNTSVLGIGSSNQVTFFSALDNTENGDLDNIAVFTRFNDGDVSEIIRRSDAGATGPFTHFGGFNGNDIGMYSFSGSHEILNSSDNIGLYIMNATSYTLVVHQGDMAPSDIVPAEHPENRYFASLHESRLNNNQALGFIGVLRDENGFAIPNGNGLFLATNLSTKTILLKGQSTPDGTATYLDFQNNFTTSIRPSMNDSAQFAVNLNLQAQSGRSQGVFRASENEVLEIARKGDAYQDGTFNRFLEPAINNKGMVVFQADLATGEAQDDEGTYTIIDDILIMSNGVNLQTIARTGQEFNGKILQEIDFNNSWTGSANGLSDSGTVVYGARYEDGTRGIHVWRSQTGWHNDTNQGDWDNPNNWFNGDLPNEFSDVILDLDHNSIIQGPSEDTTINSLTLGGSTGEISLLLQESNLSINQALIIRPSSSLLGQGVLHTSVINEGTIEIPQNLSLDISRETTNNGQITLNSSSHLRFLSRFTGAEAIEGPGTVSFEETLNLEQTPSLLNIEGNLQFTNTSVVQLKINGLIRAQEYDAIDVVSSMTLAGTLEIQLDDSVTLNHGNSFELLKGNPITGQFDTVSLPTLADQNLQITVNQSATILELVVSERTTQPPATPPTTNDPPDASGKSGGGSLGAMFSVVLIVVIYLRRRSPNL